MSIETIPNKNRVRFDDPVTSRLAARMSELTLNEVRRNVLELVNFYGASTGSELNKRYTTHNIAWKQTSWDSPRKRAGELADAGFLARRNMRVGLYNTPETEYELTVKGLEALEVNP